MAERGATNAPKPMNYMNYVHIFENISRYTICGVYPTHFKIRVILKSRNEAIRRCILVVQRVILLAILYGYIIVLT